MEKAANFSSQEEYYSRLREVSKRKLELFDHLRKTTFVAESKKKPKIDQLVEQMIDSYPTKGRISFDKSRYKVTHTGYANENTIWFSGDYLNDPNHHFLIIWDFDPKSSSIKEFRFKIENFSPHRIFLDPKCSLLFTCRSAIPQIKSRITKPKTRIERYPKPIKKINQPPKRKLTKMKDIIEGMAKAIHSTGSTALRLE